MPRVLRTLCVLLIVLGSLSGIETGYAADKWLSIRSKNFLLVGNASESSIRRVGRNLEEFRAGFALLFPAISKQSSPPITVIVFKDDGSFRPFKPLYQGKPASLAGFFQAGPDVDFIALTGDTQTPHVIYHEFVHSLAKDSAVALPPWASEGLAEFYGMFEIDSNGKEMLLGRPMDNHIATLHQDFLPVETLFAVEHNSSYYNEQTKQGIFYAESWAVIDYLMLADKGVHRPQLTKFLALLGSGKPIRESFIEAFQMDYAKLERELKTYIGQFTFPALRFKLQDKIDFDREMQVSSLTDAQSQYYLGDLLLHIGRLDTAESQFEKAISLDSKFEPSYAAMGMLKVRQGKREDALKFLTQAVEADPTNYMAHYYYAYMLQQAGDDAAVSDSPQSRYKVMRQHLKKSIELAPEYLNAYSMLGYVALLLREELPETEELLKKVFNAAPGRRDVRLQLAQLMIANKEPVAARIILKPLSEVEDDDSMRQSARSLLDQIQTYLENEQALKEYEEKRREFETAAAAAAARVPEPEPEPQPEPGDKTADAPPTLTRTPARVSSDGRTVETAAPQISRPSGQQVEGGLISVDCTRGLTLRVRVGNVNVELHTDDPSKIEFLSYTTSVSDSFACGSFKSALPVVIVYRRGTDPRYLGVPLRVEFHEKK